MKLSESRPWLRFYEGRDLPDPSIYEVSVNRFIWERNRKHRDLPALDYYGKIFTYGEFYQNIQRTAWALSEYGVKEGDIVTVCSVMMPEMAYLFYALDLLGATANMVDPRTSSEGMHEYLQEAESSFAVTMEPVYGKFREAVRGTKVEKLLTVSPAESLPGLMKLAYRAKHHEAAAKEALVLNWPDFFRRGMNRKGDFPFDNYDPERPALIVHTGGTTGTPKGVMLSCRNINALAYQCSLANFASGDRFLDVMPPFIAYGFCCGLHLPLSAGACSILIPALDPHQLSKLMKKYRPQHMAGVPLHWQTLAQDPKARNLDLSFLKTPACGGDAINAGAEAMVDDFLKAHGCPVHLKVGYGMTEVASSATCEIGRDYKFGSVGYPLYHTNMAVFEPGTEEECEAGQKGEICIAGPNVMLGYYRNPEETAKTIRRHADGTRWVHTGDIGYMDEEGFVFLTSRMKRVIIRHDGFKVFASNIENVISRHPAVSKCSAVAVPDKDHLQGKLPIVFLVLKETFAGQAERVRQELFQLAGAALPEYCLPVQYVHMEELPYTGSGKVDYRLLEEKAKLISY